MTSGRLVTAVMAAVTVALVVVPAVDEGLAGGNSTALGVALSTDSPVSEAATMPAHLPGHLPVQADTQADAPRPEPGPSEPPASRETPERSPAARKVVQLTIDDGPDTATPQVLDILARHRVPATFFIIGENAEERPELVQRIRQEGHAVGNHTWTHPWLTDLTPEGVRAELRRTEAVIGGSTCMRAPGGLVNPMVTKEANRLGLAGVDWTADSRDWQQPGVDAITRNILTNVTPGGTILIHDGGGPRDQTVAALDGVLTTLKARGYTFETVPACR